MSEIRCSGPTITINGKTFGQPFVIAATGPLDEMKKAINFTRFICLLTKKCLWHRNRFFYRRKLNWHT